ncbi:MAG: hypothetical protein Q4E13_03125 [Clostridia bacterium]|nr:hypothetical protein [Clostridia bacterium]
MKQYDCTPEMHERLFAIRNALHLSQRAMGNRMGFSDSFYGKLELRDKTISEKAVISICNEFHVRREYLLSGEGAMFDDQESAVAKLTQIYSELPETYQQYLLEYAEYLSDKHQKTSQPE